MAAEDVIVIGAGPAGIAAAIQLRRQGIDPVVFEKDAIGGLLRNANLVENYPGFPGGITGIDLVALLKKQLTEYSVRVITEDVTNLDYDGEFFVAKTANQGYHSRIMLIATGTKPKPFTEVDIPDDLLPYTHYEVYPIINEQEKRIVIVGAGDAAFDYALNLNRHNEVIILNRNRTAPCLPLLQERAGREQSISYHTNIRISKICHSSTKKVRIECIAPNGTAAFDADHLVFATGREPQIDFLSEAILARRGELEENGRLYFVGDVKRGIFRQTAIAVGDAVLAAMKIGHKLQEAN
jgi:thioredoxin reductase